MSTTTAPPTTIELPAGPIRTLLPQGSRPVSVTRLLDNEFRGHRTAAGWLPDGDAVPELAELQRDHARIRERIVRACLDLREAEESWRTQDKAHADALRDAVRSDRAEPADERLTPEERAALREQAEATIWPACEALGQVIREAMAVVRDAEDTLMGSVRRDYSAAEEKRAEAQRLLRQANKLAWNASQRGRWIMGEADDHPLDGAQPFPESTQPPSKVSAEAIRAGLGRATIQAQDRRQARSTA